MRQNIKLTSLFLMMALMLFSCEDYLDIPPEADLAQDEVFGTYRNFQGFQDQLHKFVQDYNRHGARTTMAIGGEGLSAANHSSSMANSGDYWQLIGGNGERGYSAWVSNPSAGEAFSTGLYQNMWDAIRITNMSLEKVDSELLTEATAEQRDWLKGQAYFYRAYFYYEYVRAFGTVPYVDAIITPEEQDMKRHWSYEKNGKTYHDTQAVLEKVVEDFEAASKLLPAVWPSANINYGRPTSLASLGFKAKALQFSASPLFNQQATGNLDYDKELLDRCAAACIETINLAKSIIGTQPAGMPTADGNGLTKWDDFRQAFATKGEKKQPFTPEVLFHRMVDNYGHNVYRAATARVFGAKELSKQVGAQGSQMYLDKFEMSDGSRYQLAFDADTEKRTNQRDKRLRFNHYFTGDKVDKVYIELSNKKNLKDGTNNSNIVRKYYADGVTSATYDGSTYSTPLLRLADIYLTYAEAVYEGTGSHTASAPGTGLTAEEAVNIVRRRAGQPDVAATLPHYNQIQPNSCELGSDDPFRLLYRNERAVEFAYEGVYWFDIRRWKRAHLKDGTQLTALGFDTKKDGKYHVVKEETVTRVNKQQYIFKEAHYWMPFPTAMTRFSEDWEQNPGW